MNHSFFLYFPLFSLFSPWFPHMHSPKKQNGLPKNFSVKFGPYFYYCYFYKLFFFQLHPLILNLLGIGFCNSSYLLWCNPSLMTRFASLLSWPKFDQVFFIIIFQIFFFQFQHLILGWFGIEHYNCFSWFPIYELIPIFLSESQV